MPALDRLLGFFPFVFFAGLRAEEKKKKNRSSARRRERSRQKECPSGSRGWNSRPVLNAARRRDGWRLEL